MKLEILFSALFARDWIDDPMCCCLFVCSIGEKKELDIVCVCESGKINKVQTLS